MNQWWRYAERPQEAAGEKLSIALVQEAFRKSCNTGGRITRQDTPLPPCQ